MLHFFGADQRGRSMIEILGVLGVIGVLSVGCIYGYRIAMAKYKANVAAELVSMAKVEIDVASTRHKQQTVEVDFPDNSPVSMGDYEDLKNAGMIVDFGNDIAACKQFLLMYTKHDPYFAVYDKCED